MENSFFPYIMAFAWIGILLVIGTILRAKIVFFQKLLFPAALIGGLIGFVLMNLDFIGAPSTQGWVQINTGIFSMITFHLFAFNFVGLGLLQNNDKKEKVGVTILRGSLWLSIAFAFILAVQSLIGYGVFSFFKASTGGEYFEGIGYLLGQGFSQGPGQAQSFGGIWENSFGAIGAVSNGLAFAAVGFLVAALVGIPFALYGIKKGWGNNGNEVSELPKDLVKGILDTNDRPACAYSTSHNANIDTFSLHLGIMIGVYGIAFLLGLGYTMIAPASLKSLGFGLIFAWAILASLLVKQVLNKLGLMVYIDQETIKRITGISIDFMTCAVFLSITLNALQSTMLPFIVAVVLATLATLTLSIIIGRRTPDFGFERMITLFGYCTGTAASGLLLLRIVDPEFKSTVPVELGFVNVWHMIFQNPIMLMLAMVSLTNNSILLLFLGYVIGLPILLIVLRLIKLKKVF